MRLSLTIQTTDVDRPVPVALLSGSFEEKCSKAAQYGADGVELMVAHPGELDVGKILKVLAANQLQAAAVASGAVAFTRAITLLHTNPEQMRIAQLRLEELITLAAELGAPVVTVGSFRGRAGWVEGDAWGQLVEILRAAAITAERSGVRLALEPLNRYETDVILTAQEGLEMVAAVGNPNLGLLLDTYHVNIEERSWIEPFQTAMASGKLFHVHLGDNNRLSPGRGLIDFRAVVEALHQGGYCGFLSAEHLPRPDPDTAARDTITYMRSILYSLGSPRLDPTME